MSEQVKRCIELVRQIRARKRITSEFMEFNGHLQRKKTWSLTEDEAVELLISDYDQDIKTLKAHYHKRDMDAETFKTRVDALKSLRRTDAKIQERMRQRYEDIDYRQKQTITRLQVDCNHIADLEAGTERLNAALTVLIDINSDRMTKDEWDRYNAALSEEETRIHE